MRYLHVLGVSLVLAIILLIPCVTAVVSCAPTPAPTPSPPAGPVITEAEVRSYLPTNLVVKGISPELPSGSTIWVALGVEDNYYLLDRAVTFGRVGQPGLSWQMASLVDYPEFRMLETATSVVAVSLIADSATSSHFEELLTKSMGRPLLLQEEYVRQVSYDRFAVLLPRETGPLRFD